MRRAWIAEPGPNIWTRRLLDDHTPPRAHVLTKTEKIATRIEPTMNSTTHKPRLEQTLSPMLDLISEDDTMSETLAEDQEVDESDSFYDSNDMHCRMDDEHILVITDPLTMANTTDPYFHSSMLDCTSVSEDYEPLMDLDDIGMEIVFFPCTPVGDAEVDSQCLSFAQRFESSIKKLSESMRRSSETRKCLVMKTPVIQSPESVSGVIKQVEESSKCLQTTLCTGLFPVAV